MRFHSTRESFENGEITQLAIIECVVAAGVFIFLGIHARTFRYLTVAVAVAPLALLRTEASVRWGLRKYLQLFKIYARWARVGREGGPRQFVTMLTLPLVALVGLTIRIVSTAYWTLCKPLDTLKQMPQNWIRQSLCTDLFRPPEVVQADDFLHGLPVYQLPTLGFMVSAIRGPIGGVSPRTGGKESSKRS